MDLDRFEELAHSINETVEKGLDLRGYRQDVEKALDELSERIKEEELTGFDHRYAVYEETLAGILGKFRVPVPRMSHLWDRMTKEVRDIREVFIVASDEEKIVKVGLKSISRVTNWFTDLKRLLLTADDSLVAHQREIKAEIANMEKGLKDYEKYLTDPSISLLDKRVDGSAEEVKYSVGVLWGIVEKAAGYGS